MINSFLFNTGSENTGSLIQVIESGSIGSNNLTGDTGVVSSDYNPSFSNLQTNDLILIIGSGQQVNAPAFFLNNTNPPERVQPNFVVPEGFTSILEKPIDDFNTKATSFIAYRTIPAGETSYQVELTPSTAGDTTRSTVYNYFILRGVNPKDPYSLILSSSNDDIGNINIEDSQAIIYSLYYQSSSFWNNYTRDNASPPTSSLNPNVNLNGSQPPNSFSSSISAGALNQGPIFLGVGQIKTQALVHSAFKKFDEATLFDPDAFSFSNGHAEGKSTTAIVFNNVLDGDPPIKTHIVPTSSFEVNTTTGTGSWNPPPNGNNAFYDNFGIKSLNFYYKYAYADNFTSISGTTGSGYEEPILAGTSNLVSFLENGFQKPLSSQGYYTGYYTAVDKFGNESVPADQVDTFLLTGFNAPVPEITQNGSTGFDLVGIGGGVQNTVSLSNLQVDDLVLVFAYTADTGDNTNELGVRENPDDFATVSLNGENFRNNRFKSFYRFASSTSMDIQFYRVNSTVATDVIVQYFVIRGARSDEPFHSFVFRQGNENGNNTTNILTFPTSSGILGESFNSLVLSIAGVRGDSTANRTPVIQGNVNNSLQLLNGSPDSVNREFSDIVFAAYGQEDPSSANVNDIGYPLRSIGRSAAGVLYINPTGSLNSPITPTTSGIEEGDLTVGTTTVQIVGAS